MSITTSICVIASVLNLLMAAPVNKTELPVTGDLDPASYLGPEDYAFYKEYIAAAQQPVETSWNSWDQGIAAWEEPAWNPSGWFDPWSSPNQYIKVGNYYANIIQGNYQWIVDQGGTASMYDYEGKTVVADHAAQGFAAISRYNTADLCGHTYRKVSQYIGNYECAVWREVFFI